MCITNFKFRNRNQGEYTKNTHCEKKIHLGLECDIIMIGEIYMCLTRIEDDLLFGII